ncbi:hypothetical protein DPMN_185600 [Dreissena polymorpha]|uniref:Uncharacterized protein n=1 Tax=Dreissena polymorpha TaxID=45954 RepID=A0A9D4DN39_DREPO|nr:hypothetical protein DPMN_185600 [Dreissena polymorpha]
MPQKHVGFHAQLLTVKNYSPDTGRKSILVFGGHADFKRWTLESPATRTQTSLLHQTCSSPETE